VIKIKKKKDKACTELSIGPKKNWTLGLLDIPKPVVSLLHQEASPSPTDLREHLFLQTGNAVNKTVSRRK
jgi:hypothetical protein